MYAQREREMKIASREVEEEGQWQRKRSREREREGYWNEKENERAQAIVQNHRLFTFTVFNSAHQAFAVLTCSLISGLLCICSTGHEMVSVGNCALYMDRTTLEDLFCVVLPLLLRGRSQHCIVKHCNGLFGGHANKNKISLSIQRNEKIYLFNKYITVKKCNKNI